MELKDQSFKLQDLYKIAKQGPDLSLDGHEIDKLTHYEKTSFYSDFEEFMTQQYIKINAREIQEQLMLFIFEANYDVKSYEIECDSYFTLLVDDLKFELTDFPEQVIRKLIMNYIPRLDFSVHSAGDLFLSLGLTDITNILDSEAYNFIRKFNETKKMEMKYPQKESLIKKIINKI